MHGNVWEWCQDWHWKKYYAHSPLIDPLGPETGSVKVKRGGGWYHAARFASSANRYYDSPGYCSSNLGFRLVLEAAPAIVP
jgi:formylglycine-generating enzyme required for sulfatase activity